MSKVDLCLCSVVSDSLQPHGRWKPGSFVHGTFQQEYWSGLPFPSPGDLPEPEIKSQSPVTPVTPVVPATKTTTKETPATPSKTVAEDKEKAAAPPKTPKTPSHKASSSFTVAQMEGIIDDDMEMDEATRREVERLSRAMFRR